MVFGKYLRTGDQKSHTDHRSEISCSVTRSTTPSGYLLFVVNARLGQGMLRQLKHLYEVRGGGEYSLNREYTERSYIGHFVQGDQILTLNYLTEA